MDKDERSKTIILENVIEIKVKLKPVALRHQMVSNSLALLYFFAVLMGGSRAADKIL